MEQNKSLSARIRRRNKQGFEGIGNHFMIRTSYGDYTDPEQNGKENDYTTAAKSKNKLGFKRFLGGSINKRALTKKYADGHQKLKK